MNKTVGIVIGIVIAVSLIPTMVNSIDALTTTGGALEGDAAGDLLSLVPLIFVAVVVIGLVWKQSRG
jgi:hypothetical protein